jgi:hypothetical protein
MHHRNQANYCLIFFNLEIDRFYRHLTSRVSTPMEEQSISVAGDLQPELQERAQTEVASGITEAVRERQQDRRGRRYCAAEEDGLTYEPPENPPASPHWKDRSQQPPNANFFRAR